MCYLVMKCSVQQNDSPKRETFISVDFMNVRTYAVRIKIWYYLHDASTTMQIVELKLFSLIYFTIAKHIKDQWKVLCYFVMSC